MGEIRCKGNTHWNMIRDDIVGPTFVLVREGVDVLVGSEGRDRVVVTVSVRG